MQNGKKYIPPHLRNQGGESSNHGGGDSAPPLEHNRGGPRVVYGDNRRGSYGDRHGGGSAYCGRSVGLPQTNSRWSNADCGGGRGGYGERRSHGYSGGGYGRCRVNERGFHGDMRPDSRLERKLFGREDQQTTGINFDRYDNIPVEMSGDAVPDPIDAYSIDTIGEDLMRNTQLCGYHKPTPVQKYSIPIGSAGRDLMACAQTGSGKTAGFLFPIIMSMIIKGGTSPPHEGRRRVYPEALCLAPTRELASQIHEESQKFTYCTGIASVVVYGGADVREQLRHIERGCDLLIATPGRLVDLIERGRLSMQKIRFLVLDEADRMLGMTLLC